MKRMFSARDSRDFDRRAREEFGISTLVLMENAGAAVARQIQATIKGKERLAIFCGKGNNGGDGMVAARHLLAAGIRPDIFLACGISEVKNEARVNLDILFKLKARIIQPSDRQFKNISPGKYAIIVDALLGVGLSGPVGGIYQRLIGLINSSPARVIAVDMPSGLDATSGKALGACVKADQTVTFASKKRGMLVGDGPKFCGKIIVADLGIRIPG